MLAPLVPHNIRDANVGSSVHNMDGMDGQVWPRGHHGRSKGRHLAHILKSPASGLKPLVHRILSYLSARFEAAKQAPSCRDLE